MIFYRTEVSSAKKVATSCPDHHRDIVRRLSLIGAQTQAISFAKHMVRPLEVDQTAESNNYGMEVMAYKL